MRILKDLFLIRKYESCDRKYRPVAALFAYAMLATLVYLVIFLFLRLYILVAVEFLIFVIFALITHLFNSKEHGLAIVLTFFNLTFIEVAAIYLIGFKAGTLYFLLSGIVLFYTTDAFKKPMKYTMCLLCLAEYFILKNVHSYVIPFVTLSETMLNTINEGNLLTSFGVIIYTTSAYRKSVSEYSKMLKKQKEDHEYIANFDELTNLPNRRFLYNKLDEMLESTTNMSSSFVIGIMDIDDFKNINDTYGHVCGDYVLQTISETSKSALRKYDLVGRWGGEEFLIILPQTNIENARQVMERIRVAISEATVDCKDVKGLHATVTIGCAEYIPDKSVKELIRAADKLLYEGKSSGKNVVKI